MGLMGCFLEVWGLLLGFYRLRREGWGILGNEK